MPFELSIKRKEGTENREPTPNPFKEGNN